MQIPSHVAYPEELAEDKSKGIYIKLENYRDEEKSSSREKNYKSSKNKKTYGDKKSSGKKSYSKKDSYSKDRNSKNYAKTSEKEFEKLESLPFEQRLKFYKEKYAENYNYYKNFLIDRLDNEQWLLTLDYNISAYYNLIQSPNNYSGNTNINRSLDKLGIISSYALDQFTRPGTKFKIYSNFIDSDEEGYMYTRPIK